MSRKRPASPYTLPQAKRQAIESWVDRQAPCQSIEAKDETFRCSPPLSPLDLALPSPKRCSARVGSKSGVDDGIFNLVHLDDMASIGASEVPSAESNVSIGPDMPRFQDQLRFRGVRDADQDDESVFPDDWNEVEDLMEKARESPEPTSKEHKEYRRTVRDMTNEAGLMALLVPKILKAAWEEEASTSWKHNKAWLQHIPLPRDGSAKLTVPQPDQAIGWTPSSFLGRLDGRVDAALTRSHGGRRFGSYWSPCEGLCFPVITVEGKGAAGQARIARLQNLHNASFMLNNQHELCQKAQRAEFPYQRVMAISIIITAEIAEVNCHWISKALDGRLTFWGKLLEAWGLSGRKEELYVSMRRTIRNCVEWIMARTLANIQQDVDALRYQLQAAAIHHMQSGQISQRLQDLGQSRIAEARTNNVIIAPRLSITSSTSKGSVELEGSTAATSSTSRRRKQTPSMQADLGGKLRGSRPP